MTFVNVILVYLSLIYNATSKTWFMVFISSWAFSYLQKQFNFEEKVILTRLKCFISVYQNRYEKIVKDKDTLASYINISANCQETFIPSPPSLIRLCLSSRVTVMSACIPEKDAYYHAHNMFLRHSKKDPGIGA